MTRMKVGRSPLPLSPKTVCPSGPDAQESRPCWKHEERAEGASSSRLHSGAVIAGLPSPVFESPLITQSVGAARHPFLFFRSRTPRLLVNADLRVAAQETRVEAFECRSRSALVPYGCRPAK